MAPARLPGSGPLPTALSLDCQETILFLGGQVGFPGERELGVSIPLGQRGQLGAGHHGPVPGVPSASTIPTAGLLLARHLASQWCCHWTQLMPTKYVQFSLQASWLLRLRLNKPAVQSPVSDSTCSCRVK